MIAYYTIPKTIRELQLNNLVARFNAGLYHTKNYQGTTTERTAPSQIKTLYHTKNYQGTTTE